LVNDGIITIATGKSRKEIKWKNKQMLFSQLVEKLKVTTRTRETYEEYKKLSKTDQDNIKDVGGFVGGDLKDGKRKTDTVVSRQLLTLDADFVKGDLWASVETILGCACVMYSTHKHSPESQRLRLVIPLNRPVTSDEYESIARRVAGDLGIDFFDDTTYQPHRLMYWPSTSANGEFIFKCLDEPWLNADEVLKRYVDWRDSSYWPESSRSKIERKKTADKQGDPKEKQGVIGAFCKTYTINDVIDKFLSEVYIPYSDGNRYSYVKGSTTGGLIVYENGDFAYSHHGTDPASGKLCNAFDLVRIHKFSNLDEDTEVGTPVRKMPSYKAMTDFAMKDNEVKRRIVSDKIAEAEEEFKSDEEWHEKLSINKKGQITDDLQNIVLIIENDENLKGIAYNQHRDGIDVKGSLPWKQIKTGWSDSDMSALKVYFNKTYGVWSPTKTKEALIAVAAERAYHPIKEYLNRLPEWDGTERLDKLLIDYLGADDNAYSRAVIRKTLAAAVARIYEPGKKFDSVLILNGPQGIGKSTFFTKLGGKWFSDSLTINDMRDKAAAEKLQGYWLLELGELAGIKKTDVETVKSFVSRTDDKYRASYGVNVESHLRQCVIVGSTNSENGFLRDITGNRRFWPVKVTGESSKKAWELHDIDQIWAEALYIYRKGEDLFLKGNEAKMALSEQADAMEADDREGLVREYLDKLLPENWSTMDLYERRNFLAGSEFGTSEVGIAKRMIVCSMEIWCECFGKDSANLKKADSYEITAIMSRIENWKLFNLNKSGTTRFPIYNKQRAFMRVE
jgi:putative DNA primase/helicase